MFTRIAWIVMIVVSALPAAEICSERELQGPYGLHLSGTTTISGTPTQVVGVARVVFAPDGVLSGYSSISFNGLLLGNPVSGTYEVKQDCSMTFSLQGRFWRVPALRRDRQAGRGESRVSPDRCRHP